VNPHFASLVVGLAQQAEQALQGGAPAGVPEGMDVREIARTLIDTLGMLQEKTGGHLEADEERLLAEAVTALRFRFVATEKK
jgi:Domain of unknown function (DUF1844)